MGRPLPNDLKVAVDILFAELKRSLLDGEKIRSERLLEDWETDDLCMLPGTIAFLLELSTGRQMLASVHPWVLSPTCRQIDKGDEISDRIKNASEKAKTISQAYPCNCPTPPDTLTTL